MIIPFGTLQLTDIEDCEISRKYDDEGFLRVFPQRLVRTVLIRHKVALKCGKLVSLTTQLRWELEEKKVVIFFYLGTRSATLSNPEMRVWTLISRCLAMFSFLALTVLVFLRNY